MKTNFDFRILFLCLLTLVFGCSGSDDSGTGTGTGTGENTVTSIIFTSTATSVYTDETVTFTVSGNDGSNLTSTTDFTVDGTTLVNNTFTSAVPGTFNIVATYGSLLPKSITITVAEAPLPFNKNVLIEDYTGTWCGYCPRVSYGIERVHAATDQAVVVAIHNQSSDYDPYHYPEAVPLMNSVGVTGFPTAKLNRTTTWSYPQPSNVNQVVNLTGDDAHLGLALDTSISGSNMAIDVKVKFGDNYSSSDLKLVVYIVEDGLIYNQTNYTSYYGGGSTIVGFEHNDVLRDHLTDIFGDAIPSTETTRENVYTATFNAAIPTTVSDSSNIRVVAFVINGDDAALNVRAAEFGVTQEFEEN